MNVISAMSLCYTERLDAVQNVAALWLGAATACFRPSTMPVTSRKPANRIFVLSRKQHLDYQAKVIKSSAEKEAYSLARLLASC